MPYMTEVDELLEKRNKIWDAVSIRIKKVFDRKPMYNKK